MKMKSIRLDFPAEGLSLGDREILIAVQDAFLVLATASTTAGRRRVGETLARAVVGARVDAYDDALGSPVFYVP